MATDTVTEMSADDLSTAVVDLPFHHRVKIGISSGENWLQLIRFGVVGCSGFVVNLAAFAICIHLLGIDYKIASPIAFLAGTINNFFWNRRWTFSHATQHHPGSQWIKFLVISAVAWGLSYVILVAIVSASGMEKTIAEGIASICVIPVNFLGQKFWSFKQP